MVTKHSQNAFLESESIESGDILWRLKLYMTILIRSSQLIKYCFATLRRCWIQFPVIFSSRIFNNYSSTNNYSSGKCLRSVWLNWDKHAAQQAAQQISSACAIAKQALEAIGNFHGKMLRRLLESIAVIIKEWGKNKENMDSEPRKHYTILNSYLIEQSLQNLCPEVFCSTGSRSSKLQIAHLSSFNSDAAEWNFP